MIKKSYRAAKMKTPRAPKYLGSIPPLLGVSSFAAWRKVKTVPETEEEDSFPRNLLCVTADGFRRIFAD